MMNTMLSHEEVKTFYDRFGSKQDAQAFYEDAALTTLARNSRLREANSIFEFGIGTGRFAEKLLNEYLSLECKYSGIDISSTMIDLARKRLQPWGERVTIRPSDGTWPISEQSESFDRFISNYVLDLMSFQDISAFIGEAHRVLKPDGLLCLVSLTEGKTWLSRIVSAAWNTIYHWQPSVVGGCRPIKLAEFISDENWQMEYHTTVVAFGITSDAFVARRLP
jgi:ubiquinone/menaquinone biosynthesis C-methylase UbiE